MNRSLYFKIILILSVFIITVMCIVGIILLTSITGYYSEAFESEMTAGLSPTSRLYEDLMDTVSASDDGDRNIPKELKAILQSYSADLGIDSYRNYYILDMNGNMLEGSDSELGVSLVKTENMISAMNRKNGTTNVSGADYADYAVYLSDGEAEYIVYIKDTQEETDKVTWILFSIVVQALLIGLLCAFVLAFVLARAITSPIQKIIEGVKRVSNEEFNEKLVVSSDDEIGALAHSFNKMSDRLRLILDEVRGEQQKLQMILACLQDGVVAFADNGSILHINDAARGILNYTGGQYDYAMLAEAFQLPESCTDLFEEKTIYNDIVYNGHVYDVSFGKIRYSEDSETHIGTLTIIHDETNRYELDNSRREFVSNVSHELRTPLMSIRGAGETIISHPEMDETTRNMFLELAVGECDRMTRIVEDLLVLSRLDNNRTVWHIERFDINAMLERQCEVLRMNAAAKQHVINFIPSEKKCFICADKEKIEQVMANIIGNSIKYTHNGGQIDVKVDAKKNGASVSIKDNGIGIPEADIPRLFERFYRVGKARSTDEGGTGLGLAIANEIITSHAGNIKVESTLGEGTEVTVFLPEVTPLGRPEQNEEN